jgi:hypothetical protein
VSNHPSPSVTSEPPLSVEPEDFSEPEEENEPETPIVEKPTSPPRRSYQELTTAEAAKRLGYESDRGFRKAALKGMVCRNGWCAESVSEGQRGKSGLWKVWPEGSGRKKGKPTAKTPAPSKLAAKANPKPGSNKAKKA